MKQRLLGMTATAVVGSSLFATVASAENIEVKKGDTLWSLSQEYNTTVTAIKETNGLVSDFLYAGQVLNLPKLSSEPNVPLPAPTPAQVPTSKDIIHFVKSGDSLWAIAKAYNTTVNNIKGLNGLTSDTIMVGQKLTIKKEAIAEQSNEPKKSIEQTISNTPTHITYKVKTGDTLWKVANQYNITVAEIKVINNLKSDFISSGQVLKLVGENSKPGTTTNENLPSQNDRSNKINVMVSEAKAVLGTPYRWAGNTPAGFDCSGFIYYVLNKVTSVSRLSTAGYWDIMKPVSSPNVGDFVFFTTYKAGPSHIGIYLGNNEFIHASSTGVSISNMENSYWKPRYLGAKQIN